MNAIDGLQIVAFCVVLIALSPPLGKFMARVFRGERTFLHPLLGPVERLVLRTAGDAAKTEMRFKDYLLSLLAFNAVGFVVLFGLLIFQGVLPLWNPDGIGPMKWDLAFNTAISFVTNTNWQNYSGEAAASHFTQMVGLTVQNFVSAATGIAVLVALARGIQVREKEALGNFWVDLTRGTVYVLLPLSLVLALALSSQGVVQAMRPSVNAQLVQPQVAVAGGSDAVTTQTIPLGPAASQIAIKQLGTNGGGFFGVNSAHPFENPNPLTNFLEMLSILLLASSLCYTFGILIGDRRQGVALLLVMWILFAPCIYVTSHFEQEGNPALSAMGVDSHANHDQSGGNMEGKEVRFGVVNSALWAVSTTAASNGSVNSMHDAYMPMSTVPLFFLMQLGEIVFGGVGSGLYGLLAFAILGVFAAGLMVGRTPEIFGKKIETFEMKMATLTVLVPTMVMLLGTAAAVLTPSAKAAVGNGGPHAFSEILYAFTSQGGNNGSAFVGLDTSRPFYNVVGAIVMAIERFAPIAFMLAIAGSLARKKTVPAGPGTLPTHSALFIFWLVAVVVIMGALSFLPALALGPFVEHLLVGSISRF